MFVAQVGFAREVSPDAITELLGTWWNNGQVVSNDYAIAAQLATVLLPEKSSLDPRHDSEWASRARHAVGSPSIKVLGRDEGTDPACDCSQPSAYVLFTHYLMRDSPLRCLDCAGPVPLYRIGWDGDYHRIMTWRADYHACDTLQMNCQTLETAATAELSDLGSSLTKRGRDICASIMSSTRVPTLYYLYGYRSALECPSCSRKWRLRDPLMRIFDCRCDDCHLLSNVD